MSLWFVQPVHGRVGLTRLCMEQRRRMLDELAGLGVEAEMVVVGNDGNLATARELGFHTLERPNVLGRKVNAGFEYACAQGADFVSFIGSDDWALASWFATMPTPDHVKTSKWLAAVAPGGGRLIARAIQGPTGNPPWIIPRSLLARTGFRPCERDNAMSGIDGLIHSGLSQVRELAVGVPAERRALRRSWETRFEPADDDMLRFVDFKGSREQITPFSQVTTRERWIALDEPDPWPVLATRYPVDLVERMEKFYAEGMPQ